MIIIERIEGLWNTKWEKIVEERRDKEKKIAEGLRDKENREGMGWPKCKKWPLYIGVASAKKCLNVL